MSWQLEQLWGHQKLLCTSAIQVRAALLREIVPKSLHRMWRALQKYDREELNSLFSDPVPAKDYPGYYENIAEPMDLKTLG